VCALEKERERISQKGVFSCVCLGVCTYFRTNRREKIIQDKSDRERQRERKK
jgi:hypothetical protein